MEQKRDEDLLAEHLAGDAGAFEMLVARYADDLYSFFARFVGNAAAADDLVQETLLQVYLAAATFDAARPFKPWLYTVAANKARDYLRARGRRPEQSLDAFSADSDAPSPSSLVEAADVSAPEQMDSESLSQLVRAKIAQMPEHLRLILILGYYQRLPYAEIAEILEIPVGTVKSRLHSAVEHFARLWLGRGRTAAPPD